MSVYKLQCDDGHFYIGSTKNNLKTRFAGHKHMAKYHPSRVYTHIRTIGIDKVKIELVEECENYRERENYHIQQHKTNPLCLNVNDALRDPEYYQHNKEELIKRQLDYYYANREKRLAYQNEYQKRNKEKINAYQKEYRMKRKTNATRRPDDEGTNRPSDSPRQV